jgi:hypothetical protein
MNNFEQFAKKFPEYAQQNVGYFVVNFSGGCRTINSEPMIPNDICLKMLQKLKSIAEESLEEGEYLVQYRVENEGGNELLRISF